MHLRASLLTDKEAEAFDIQARKFHADDRLPPLKEDDRVDTRWASVDVSKYPVLTKLVKAAISSFHGPIVESAFSIMSAVIGKHNTSIDIETFSANQTARYYLMAQGKTSIQYFGKQNPVKEPVDKKTNEEHVHCLEERQ